MTGQTPTPIPLSPAKREALADVAAHLLYVGRDPGSPWYGSGYATATLRGLVQRGLIKRGQYEPGKGHRLTLTDAGRAALPSGRSETAPTTVTAQAGDGQAQDEAADNNTPVWVADMAQTGIDTPGCDCGHDGMGTKWHATDCAWRMPTTATVPGGGPREPAYDLVRAYLRELGDHVPPDPVHRNAIIWQAVNAALAGIQPVIARAETAEAAITRVRLLADRLADGDELSHPDDEITKAAAAKRIAAALDGWTPTALAPPADQPTGDDR